MHRCILLACLALSLTLTPCLCVTNAQPKPGCVCTAIYDPVCGSDGRDYSSACQADCAGVTVASHGMCSDAAAVSNTPTSSSSAGDGTQTGVQLPGGLTVKLPAGTSGDSSAGCLCTSISSPVCGEDGQTYTNDCQASCAGIQVVAQGACKSSTTAATPPAPVASQQGNPAPAAAAAAPGCVCAAMYDPVCGVNGKDYPSACDADCAGVSVASKGVCKPAAPTPVPAPVANSSSPAPVASANQDTCACPRIYDPVCTDKGVTRSNKCVAGCQNETVVSEGSCSHAGEGTAKATTTTNAAAATGIVANVSASPVVAQAAANTTAFAGACGGCGDSYSPVCGVDGVTYSNSCEAECLNGVQVSFAGVCASRSAAPAGAANTTNSTAVRSSAVGLRAGSSSSVFGGFAVAAAALLGMLWL